MKYIFSVRGDGASRFCPMCKNLFVLKAAVCSEEDDEDCSMMCKTIKHSELDLCTDSELFQAWDRLADRRGNVSAGDWKLWQQATGMTFTAHGLLEDKSLRHMVKPLKQWCHDYMHGMCSNGVMNSLIFWCFNQFPRMASMFGISCSVGFSCGPFHRQQGTARCTSCSPTRGWSHTKRPGSSKPKLQTF